MSQDEDGGAVSISGCCRFLGGLSSYFYAFAVLINGRALWGFEVFK